MLQRLPEHADRDGQRLAGYPNPTPNKVVLVTHHGYEEDLRLAASLRDVGLNAG